jgi:ATP-dependent exoDNAse (exonuclease V) beta subunit
MSLGTAAHCFILQPEKFAERFQIVTDGRSRECKEAKLNEKEIIKQKDLERLINMKQKLHEFHELRNFEATDVLINGTKELLIEHEKGAYIHTGELDAIDTERDIIVDYKTTSAPSVYHAFWDQQVARYYLHLQMAYYGLLYHYRFNKKAKRFFHVVQSVEPPYVVSCFELGKEAIETGKKLIQSAIDTISAMIEEDLGCRVINVAESPATPYHPGVRESFNSYRG